jgi:MFS family permease
LESGLQIRSGQSRISRRYQQNLKGKPLELIRSDSPIPIVFYRREGYFQRMQPEVSGDRNSAVAKTFYYGWVVLGVSFLTTLVGAGIRSSPAVFIHPFESEFGWSRGEISFALSINLLLFGVAAPISGWLLDRYGPRRVMMICLSLLVAGVAGTTFMHAYWQLVLLWGILVGLAAGGVGSVLSATVANRWFVARRGLALGILNSAGSTGQLIFIPLLMFFVSHIGWRTGSWTLVAAVFALLPVIFLFMRDDPADVGLKPYGAKEGAAAKAAAAESVPLGRALKSSTFWLLAGSFFVCGGTANGLIGTHLIPHSIDHGISEVTAATTVGIMGGLNFVGTILSGWMIDRVAPRKWLSLVFALRAVSLFFLPFVTDYSGYFIFAVVYGLDWFATVPPVVALTADTFGKRAVASVYGWIFLAHQLGASLMATGGGLIHDWLNSYQMAFFAGGALALIASGLAWQIRPRRYEATAAVVADVPSA